MRRLSDDELLDFDSRRYADYRRSDARRALREHGDAYRAQLVAAHMLAGYRDRRLARNDRAALGFSEEYMEGWDEAMRDVIAHLRQGDFLPGSGWFEDEIEARMRAAGRSYRRAAGGNAPGNGRDGSQRERSRRVPRR